MPEARQGPQRRSAVPGRPVRSTEEHNRSRRSLGASRAEREAAQGAQRSDGGDPRKHRQETKRTRKQRGAARPPNPSSAPPSVPQPGAFLPSRSAVQQESGAEFRPCRGGPVSRLQATLGARADRMWSSAWTGGLTRDRLATAGGWRARSAGRMPPWGRRQDAGSPPRANVAAGLTAFATFSKRSVATKVKKKNYHRTCCPID